MRFTGWIAVLLGAGSGCGFKPTAAAHDGGTGDLAGDAALDAPPEDLGPCGSPGAIRDDFADGQVAGIWRATRTTAEAGGTLSVTPDTNEFAGYSSKHRIDLTGASVTVEVPAMVDPTTNAQASLYLFADENHYVAITELHGALRAESANGGAASHQDVIYDELQQRWWRIREAGGDVIFEVSPDGTLWTALAAPVTTPPWIDRVEVGLGGYSDGTAHGTVQFANLNQDLKRAGWCKADTFSDPFMRPMLGYDWTARKTPEMATGCTAAMTNAGAHFDQNGTVVTRCWLSSGPGFDLAGSHAMIYVPAITSYKPGWYAFLRAIDDDVTDAFVLQFDNGQLCAQVHSDPAQCIPYDAQVDLYWRIREQAGVLWFETGRDATSWTTIAMVPDPFPLATLELEIGTDATATFTGPIGLAVTSYNVP